MRYLPSFLLPYSKNTVPFDFKAAARDLSRLSITHRVYLFGAIRCRCLVCWALNAYWYFVWFMHPLSFQMLVWRYTRVIINCVDVFEKIRWNRMLSFINKCLKYRKGGDFDVSRKVIYQIPATFRLLFQFTIIYRG